MTRLLIAGATGMVGKVALAKALADPRVEQVVTLTRRPIPPHPKLENVVGDFSAWSGREEWWSVDGVISALGTTRGAAGSVAAYRQVDFDYPLAIARYSRDHGAIRLSLVSSLGANARSWFAYPRLKGEVEEAIRTVGYPALTIVRPSVLDGNRSEYRPDERAANRLVGMLGMLGPLMPSRLRLSRADAVAAALVEGAVAAAPGTHILHNADLG